MDTDMPLPDAALPIEKGHILRLMCDEVFLGKEFGGDSWAPWQCVNKAIYGLPMDDADKKLWVKCTGRAADDIPADGFKEAFVIVGRRGGKSVAAAVMAIHAATMIDWTPVLKPGERATIVIVSPSRAQSRTILRYIVGLLSSNPTLEALIDGQPRATGVDLDNNVSIEVVTCNFRLVRNFTIVMAICDEAAYWSQEDSANPDVEVLNALRPAMLTTGGRLIVISSPYGKSGILWDAYSENWGVKGAKDLCWKADTLTMNPTANKAYIARQYARDPVSAAAEYGAEFRDARNDYVSAKAVAACTEKGVFQRPYVPGFKYRAFVDAAGGSGKDSFTLAITHVQKGKRRLKDESKVDQPEAGPWAIHDLQREWKPPFNPDDVAADIAQELRGYCLTSVTGDPYGGGYVKESFRRVGIIYHVSKRSKSEIYTIALSLIMSGRAVLLDNDTLIKQLLGLQRSVSKTGKDTIDHTKGPTNHDDVANAACGALALVDKPAFVPHMIPYSGGGGGGIVDFTGRGRDSQTDLPPRKSPW